VIRYLKHNPGHGLLFHRKSELQILGYVDEDWAWYVNSRRSTTSLCFFLGSYLISWCVKKQQTTFTITSSEAEYKALFYCSMWITMVIVSPKGFTYCMHQTTDLSDNRFYTVMLKFYTHASNCLFHERTKFLEIDSHLVKRKSAKWCFKIVSYF